MAGPLISVIIPVYNVEKYLEKCINSVIGQTYKNIEIIIVDDGSTDKSGLICDFFAGKDTRIVVIHKVNGGLSSARNAGLDIAKGDYIGFVDSDDWIEPDMYECLLCNMLKENADISVCGVYYSRENKTKTDKDTTSYCVLSRYEAICSTVRNNGLIKVYAWNKLYSRHVFEKLRFPEGKTYEDWYTILPAIDAAKIIVVSMQPKYHYLKRPGSITNSEYGHSTWDIVEARRFFHKYLLDRYPELAEQAEYFCLISYYRVLDKMLLSKTAVDRREKKALIGYLRESTGKMLKYPQVTKKRKIAAITLYVSEYAYLLSLHLYSMLE